MVESASLPTTLNKKHKQLLRIAIIANIVGWVVLAVTLILFGYQIVEAVKAFVLQNVSMGYFPDTLRFFLEKPIEASRPFINVIYFLLRGITYFLVLWGVSLGLNMIVEIDLNYIERLPETENDG